MLCLDDTTKNILDIYVIHLTNQSYYAEKSHEKLRILQTGKHEIPMALFTNMD